MHRRRVTFSIPARASRALGPALCAACLGCLASVGPAVAANSSVRSCGGGEVVEYPYFDVKAHGASCPAARVVIQRFFSAHSHWHAGSNAINGRWTSPGGWRCTGAIPRNPNENGHEFCRRGAAWISSQSGP